MKILQVTVQLNTKSPSYDAENMCHVFNGYSNFSSPGEDGTLKNTFNMKDVLLSQTNIKSRQEGGGKIILKFAVFLYILYASSSFT